MRGHQNLDTGLDRRKHNPLDIYTTPPLLWRHIRVLSFGGGTQSMAALVAQAQGLLKQPYDVFLMADVGHDSENQATTKYLWEYAVPFAMDNNIPLLLERRQWRDGRDQTLLEYALSTKRSVPIPARMSNGAPGNRTCTADFKIKVVDRWVKDHGYTHATMGLCFSTDEAGRVKGKHKAFKPSLTRHGKRYGFQKRFDFPILELGYNRNQSIQLVTDAGLPKPPRSSCWFCPFTSRKEWFDMRQSDPDTFQKAVLLEAIINKKRGAMGRDAVRLHPARQGRTQPLIEATYDPLSMFEETCDSGYCHM